MTAYPKRLIEVDLPIKRISAHARREKSIRHGHISTLHIWWARRPVDRRAASHQRGDLAHHRQPRGRGNLPIRIFQGWTLDTNTGRFDRL
jgi:Protein of unknown function (DUF1156)